MLLRLRFLLQLEERGSYLGLSVYSYFQQGWSVGCTAAKLRGPAASTPPAVDLAGGSAVKVAHHLELLGLEAALFVKGHVVLGAVEDDLVAALGLAHLDQLVDEPCAAAFGRGGAFDECAHAVTLQH